eukprot:SAG22_NODE_782_length_7256_cov_8.627498_4_plen_225_part_00
MDQPNHTDLCELPPELAADSEQVAREGARARGRAALLADHPRSGAAAGGAGTGHAHPEATGAGEVLFRAEDADSAARPGPLEVSEAHDALVATARGPRREASLRHRRLFPHELEQHLVAPDLPGRLGERRRPLRHRPIPKRPQVGRRGPGEVRGLDGRESPQPAEVVRIDLHPLQLGGVAGVLLVDNRGLDRRDPGKLALRGSLGLQGDARRVPPAGSHGRGCC